MGTRGRNPKPLAILGPTSRHGTEERPAEAEHAAKAPPCPRWLTAEGRKEWKRVVKIMTEQRTLTALDLGILASYCEAVGILERATQDLTDPEDAEKVEGRCLRAGAKVKEFGMQLGFTPASRGRVNPVTAKAAKPKVMSRQREA